MDVFGLEFGWNFLRHRYFNRARCFLDVAKKMAAPFGAAW